MSDICISGHLGESYPCLARPSTKIYMSTVAASTFTSATTDHHSRKRTIGMEAISCGLGCALEAGAMNLPMFTMGCLVTGCIHFPSECFVRLFTRIKLEKVSPSPRSPVSTIFQGVIWTQNLTSLLICPWKCRYLSTVSR